MPKAYWMVHVDVIDAQRYARYVELDTPVVAAFGGRFLARGGGSEAPESAQRARHVVVEFPDMAQALACYHSPEYQEAAKIRLAYSESDFVIVEGIE